ncbi:MAG: fatty acid desaturase [Chitinophagaceae bacterium]|nr:fatty acid desaturase [Chitinophagaceae bacterium]
MSMYVGCYTLFVFFTRSYSELMLLAVVLGVCHVFLPVNISHDAIHGAVSSKNWLNDVCSYGLDITGSNSFMYKLKHLEAHYNKENGSKTTAIESQGLLLQTRHARGSRNVHVVFYALYSQYMIFVRDFLLFLRLRKQVPGREWIKLVFFKLLYCTAFIVLPFMFVKLPWWQVLTALLLMYLVVTIVLVIILLMPTDRMEHSRASGNHANEKWIVEILEHNVDFSPESAALNLLAGGANLNVVHYLFPTVNHVHYNKLASIIERTAPEFGLQYRKQLVRDVFGIHFRYLKNIQNANG